MPAKIYRDNGAFHKDNLVVLMYASNNCYTQVRDLSDKEVPDNLEIDAVRRTWSWSAYDMKFNEEIGKSRLNSPRFNFRQGVIGVYDRAITRHLDAMAWDSEEATRKESSVLED